MPSKTKRSPKSLKKATKKSKTPLKVQKTAGKKKRPSNPLAEPSEAVRLVVDAMALSPVATITSYEGRAENSDSTLVKPQVCSPEELEATIRSISGLPGPAEFLPTPCESSLLVGLLITVQQRLTYALSRVGHLLQQLMYTCSQRMLLVLLLCLDKTVGWLPRPLKRLNNRIHGWGFYRLGRKMRAYYLYAEG